MELPGRRKQGRPKRRWRDCVREDMTKCGLTEADAQDRSKWKKVNLLWQPLKKGNEERRRDVMQY